MDQIILIRNNDSDVVGAVFPGDALNPEITIEEIERDPDLHCELIIVNTYTQWLEANEDR